MARQDVCKCVDIRVNTYENILEYSTCAFMSSLSITDFDIFLYIYLHLSDTVFNICNAKYPRKCEQNKKMA